MAVPVATLLKAIVLPVAIAIVTYRLVVTLSPIQPLPLILPPLPPSVGPFSPNSLLLHINKIGVGQLPQPEDVAVDRLGRLYVGCSDGWIKRIDPSSWVVENWTRIDGGRPLGLAVGLHDELIVCEPNMGLLNVTDEGIEVLSSEGEGLKFKLTDAAIVARDGSIYFTDASHKYSLEFNMLDIMEAGRNGRLLKYNPATRSTTVLLKDLYFANGVALSADESFLVFCETTASRLQRYWLKGEKRGKSEIFIDNLPAFPDNVKNDGNGLFWIALIAKRSALTDLAFRYPFLRHLQVVLNVTKYIIDRKRALVLSVTEEGVPVSTFGDPNGAAIHEVTTGIKMEDFVEGMEVLMCSKKEVVGLGVIHSVDPFAICHFKRLGKDRVSIMVLRVLSPHIELKYPCGDIETMGDIIMQCGTTSNSTFVIWDKDNVISKNYVMQGNSTATCNVGDVMQMLSFEKKVVAIGKVMEFEQVNEIAFAKLKITEITCEGHIENACSHDTPFYEVGNSM